MFCDRCGVSNRDEASFCRSCGASLAGGEPPPTVELPSRAPRDDPHGRLEAALAGKFEILRLLGRGGMGAVYLAKDLALERLVAIKVLPKEVSSDEKKVQRFLQEARIAARLRHPNIVSIHTVGEAKGVHYFTMDYIEGETLAARIGPERPWARLRAEEASRLFCDIARAVAHAHGQGVIHRDLKPGNVMIDSTGHVVVLDFGLARREGRAGLTTSGIVVGTPQYMSPEQIHGKPATVASDIFALALVGYFLMTSEELLAGEDIMTVAGKLLTTDLGPVVAEDHRIPEPMRSCLGQMLRKDPDRRPRSVADALGLLEGKVVSPQRATPGQLASNTPIVESPTLASTTPRSPDRELSDGDEVDYVAAADRSMRNGAYDAALRYYSRAVGRDSRNEVAWLGQLVCLLTLGEWNEAIAWADRAIGIFAQSAEMLAIKAVAVGRSGDTEGAMALSDRSLKEGERKSLVWWARGDVYVWEDLETTEECFQRAMELGGNDWRVPYLCGRSYLAAERPEEARAHLLNAKAVDPEVGVVWYHLGLAERDLEKSEEAARALERAVEINPSFDEAQKALQELKKIGPFRRSLRRLARKLLTKPS